ncbi:hypothetical protein N7462_008425 [Penicillium macrosclerotiorum]|uniref:uncharacterized protein n=1 Tax=Penicillium macrosclerotiorum TaxID=303699 RepID=UPI002547C184|nr:uncharacterized protein N7462_008425 [Penicillium macrosclerotiorum]KAJ5675528.1 hypothetical protein N7462_008425 [Penicillium macrosclerotiorum]
MSFVDDLSVEGWRLTDDRCSNSSKDFELLDSSPHDREYFSTSGTWNLSLQVPAKGGVVDGEVHARPR